MEDNPLLSYNQQYNSALLECRCSVGLAQNVHFLCPHCYDVAIASFNKIFFCISNFVLGTYNCWHPTKTTNALDIHCSEWYRSILHSMWSKSLTGVVVVWLGDDVIMRTVTTKETTNFILPTPSENPKGYPFCHTLKMMQFVLVLFVFVTSTIAFSTRRQVTCMKLSKQEENQHKLHHCNVWQKG